jgi:M6 family metalloprotease-like protein
MRYVRLIVLAVVVFASVVPATAGPANPRPYTLIQPDGSVITVRLVGDEWSNAEQTLDGYTVLRNEATGFYVYADKLDGVLVATDRIVGRDQPAGLTPGLKPDAPADRYLAAVQQVGALDVTGARSLLVILVKFNNQAEATTAPAWQSRMFGASNSVKHHYTISSHGTVTVTAANETHGTANDGIVGWLTLNQNHPNTGQSIDSRNQVLAKDAIVAADPFVNFAAYDTNGNGSVSPSELDVIVIVAGNETSYGGSGSCSPSVWGHVWSIFATPPPTVDGKVVGGSGYGMFGEMHCFSTQATLTHQATIGIMAHELGHLYGLPDLYDSDGSSEGVGEWSLMGSGSWNFFGGDSGNSPALMDAWSKSVMGWTSRTIVTGTLAGASIPSSSASGALYQFRTGTPGSGSGEFFLVENRQKTSYDQGLAGSGLLIWHIDETRSSNASECIPGGSPACSATVHYKVAAIQADNLFNLERGQNRSDAGDPFPGTSNKTSFTPSSSPNSNLWSGASSGISITGISASAATMTATLSDGTSPAFTDPTLSVGVTPVKAIHVTELRSRIDGVRVARTLPAFSWTNPTLTATTSVIMRVHVTEMRSALAAAYAQAGQPLPTYTDPDLTGLNVKAVHILELRAAVVALESSF